MSSPAQGGPSVPKEKEKKGFGKVLSRMKTVFKKSDSSRRQSTLGTPADSSSSAVKTGDDAVKAAQPATTQPPAAAATTTTTTTPEPTKIPRSQLFAERAKKLGELYGLELKPSEWHSTEGHALRVEKPIRMRVHRKCHLCSTSFGASKECPNCKHPRCKQCPRSPPKRTEAEREESRKKRAAIIKERAEKAPIIPDWDPTPKKIVLKRPAKTGGQDLIYRKPRQRIRRTCCQCHTLFPSGTKTCTGCNHGRCTDCPRDPAKKDKFPYGYPGDGPGMKVGHYECAECKNIFSLSPPQDAPACPKCKHSKCDRLKPRKVEPEPDPEVLKSLQAKLEGLKLK